VQDEERTAVQQERVLSEQLWCVHIEGPDDFVATASREIAEQEAAAINAYVDSTRRTQSTTPAPMAKASAVVWPYTEAGHARSLETDWHDLQRMPHRRANETRREGLMSSLLRWIATFTRSRS
jgi:hypothetical protein